MSYTVCCVLYDTPDDENEEEETGFRTIRGCSSRFSRCVSLPFRQPVSLDDTSESSSGDYKAMLGRAEEKKKRI